MVKIVDNFLNEKDFKRIKEVIFSDKFLWNWIDGVSYHKNNPNGSVDNIAGIYSQNHRILGLMPHPERRVSSEIGLDGERLFRSLNI